MGFVPQPVLAAVVAALATVASLSCADSHQPTDPSFAPEVRPPSAGQTGEKVLDIVNKPKTVPDRPEVAERLSTEARMRVLESEIRKGT